jgi:hydroxymethylpyrimidine pyrophosphatase-like HAD family hydrolase
MESSVRLLIADVDGTLVTPDKVLTARAIEAVRLLRADGIAFAITSGRPPMGMKMLIDLVCVPEKIKEATVDTGPDGEA